jgi:hypothetical protein
LNWYYGPVSRRPPARRLQSSFLRWYRFSLNARGEAVGVTSYNLDAARRAGLWRCDRMPGRVLRRELQTAPPTNPGNPSGNPVVVTKPFWM